MKFSLIPVTLSPEQFEVVATVARLKGSTIGEFIVESSLMAALRSLHAMPGDLPARKRGGRPRPVHRTPPPES